MNTESWIIIPDVHGCRFWRDAVKGHEDENIIFLGDYLDPYSREGISPLDASGELEDIREICERGDLLGGYTHIFGHTMQTDGIPKEITSGAGRGWCLDCLKAFRMGSDGTIGEFSDLKRNTK